MKKKLLIIFASILILFALTFLWWNTPTTFLSSVDAKDISAIHVRNGHNGNIYEIKNQEDIKYIVENIQNHSFEKGSISLFRMGTWFTLSFCDKDGKVISKFIINGDDTIRKDPLFYKTDEGVLQKVIDYLSEIEKTMDSSK